MSDAFYQRRPYWIVNSEFPWFCSEQNSEAFSVQEAVWTFPHPGSLQAADLAVERCWTLQSCDTNTEFSSPRRPAAAGLEDVYRLGPERAAAALLTRHDALVHQLLPGPPLLQPQLQDCRETETRHEAAATERHGQQEAGAQGQSKQ